MTPAQTAILCTALYVAFVLALAWVTRNRD